MVLNKNNLLKLITILSISTSFFLGYFLRENASGGGREFYDMSWPIIQSFKNDFLFTINNYAKFGDGTFPFSHIINAYLNPFTNTESSFQLSNTIISFLIFIIFSLILKKIYYKIEFINILLISSVILLLPFFRTSAFWGKNENFGWLFFMLALYFFFEIKKNINKNPDRKDITQIFLFCFTSSCALYARQALVFLPCSYLLYLFFYQANKKIIIFSIIFFIIFSIPGILLIFTWGGLYDTTNLASGAFYGQWLHHKYLFRNIPILLSFFGFYLLPFLAIEFFNSNFKYFLEKYFKSFIFALVTFIIFSQLDLLNYLGNYEKSGGAVLKVNYLLKKNNFFLLIIFSSIGFSTLYQFFKEDKKNNSIMIFPMFIVYCFPALLYQEYVEPLILLMFFLTLKTNLQNVYFKNIKFSNAVFISYFFIYLIGSIYFKHFAFTSFDEWNLYLNF